MDELRQKRPENGKKSRESVRKQMMNERKRSLIKKDPTVFFRKLKKMAWKRKNKEEPKIKKEGRRARATPRISLKQRYTNF